MADIDFKYSDIDSLIPYAMNSRTHSDEQIAQIAASIREFGFLTPVLIDSSGNLIAGHGRLLASRKLGLKQIPSVVADGLTDAQRKAYVIADNKLALNAGWDEDLLRIELQSLVDMDFDISLTGFDDDFIRDLLVEENGGLTDPDDAPSVDDINQPVTQSGDIWLLGKHRLMCGDSTSVDAISELCQKNLVDMWLTDPPYNVAYEGKTKDALTIKNDEMGDADFRVFLAAAYEAANSIMKPGAVFYIWHADSEGYNFRGAANDIGWKIRQCLIWQKNGMVLGRQDYHWQHEPCQPPGTLVRTPDGSVPIENLKNGDKVVSYNSYSGTITGMRDGREIKVASRHYDGELYGVCVGSKQTWTTDSHRFSVRFKDGAETIYCTYLMRRGDWWRVGVTSTYNARGFGLKHRMRQEHADEAWIISTHKDKLDAFCAEQILAVKYGVPMTHWEVERGIKNKVCESRSSEMISKIYGSLDLSILRSGAHKMLADYGRRPSIPFTTKETQYQKCSRRVTVQVAACNIIPEIMEVPVAYEKWDTENKKTFDWEQIKSIDRKHYSGLVYSLDVEKDKHYIADGIVTHNCLYGWKDGASHLWASDRKQTTLLDFAKPTRNGEHPTMKPVGLFEYQMLNNTKGGDVILDSFGGSGTTLIAAEKNGRIARIMELDPKYCDVIIKRWQEFTGKDAILERNSITFNELVDVPI